MLLRCPTEHALLLLAVSDESGLLRFPGSEKPSPGILLGVNPGLGLGEQFVGLFEKTFPSADTNTLHIYQGFHATLQQGGQTLTLYAATCGSIPGVESESWPTMPELLRQLPKNRNRLAYVKAWQVLSGALDESTKAVDIDDLRAHLDPDPES